MIARILLLLFLLGLMGLALWGVVDAGDGETPELAPGAVEPETALDPGEMRAPVTRERTPAEGRVAQGVGEARAGAADGAAADPATAPAPRVRGRVLDLRGAPVADVTVRRESRDSSAVSDRSGSFELAPGAERRSFDAGGGDIVADDPDWATVFESAWDAGAIEREHLVVVAGAVELAGRVVEADGSGVAGAVVSIEGLDGAEREFPHSLHANRLVRYEATTTGDGRFVLAGAPALPESSGARIVAREGERRSGRVDLPTRTRSDLRLEFAARDASAQMLRGVVLLPDGRPADGARVRLADQRARTGSNGEFALPLEGRFEGQHALAAGLRGYGPAVVQDFGEVVAARAPGAPPPVTLRLGPSFAIAGRVLDADDEPQRGFDVRLLDPTPLSVGQIPVVQAEALGSGNASVTTDEDGGFRLEGLLDREYRLVAIHSPTLLRIESGPIAAGTEGIELRVPADVYLPRVQGTVVDRGGAPVPGATVSTGLVLERTDFGHTSMLGESVTTDEVGEFELTHVPRRYAHLAVAGDAIVPASFDLDADVNPDDWTLEVARRCNFRFVGPADLDDGSGLLCELLDANDEPLSITTYRKGSSISFTTVPLEAGTSAVRSASQDARRLRVHRWVDGAREVVHEQEIWLDPAVVSEIAVELP